MYSDSDDEDLGGLPDLPPVSRMMLARQNTEGHIQTNEPGQSLLPEDAQLDEEASETVNVLMIGTGEYTTGFVHGSAAHSDKSCGVVALSMMDMRRRGLVGQLALCGRNSSKFPAIQEHIQRAIVDVYDGMDATMSYFPSERTECNEHGYLEALEAAQPGDVVTIFTPDDTHFEIALACVEKGLHVYVAKPLVKTLEQHQMLLQAAREKGVLVATEYHKRFDPIYADARDRINSLGPLSYFNAYMSQPKSQLATFSSWLASGSSDISYYLNSHHIDFLVSSIGHKARAVSVVGMGSRGCASEITGVDTEDSITLTVQFETLSTQEEEEKEGGEQSQSQQPKSSFGTAVFTASWIAPKSDVHSQQRFFCSCHKGEVSVNQARRGYELASEDLQDGSLRNQNPLFMKYTPRNGQFVGQEGYGYKSFELFVRAASQINQHLATPKDYESFGPFNVDGLAGIGGTLQVTAILEAGRRSLDNGSRPVGIRYENEGRPLEPTSVESF
jgi:D-galacturonate reductase